MFQYAEVLGSDGYGRTWLVGLLLVLVTLALYWPARHYDFVELDDPGYVFENQTVRQGLSSWGLIWTVVDAHESNWHPVTWLSHMLDCQLFGLRPGAHHMVNVLLHCANAVLLFLLLRLLTGAFWPSALAAAVFAWHPLRVESVAWISERKDVLSGFFFMLTLLCYTRYVQSPKPNSAGFRGARGRQVQSPDSDAPVGLLSTSSFYGLALLFFALGLMSKPMLVTVPLVLVLLDFWPLRRFAIGNQKSEIRSQIVEKLPFFLLSFAVGVITYAAQHSSGAMVSLKTESLGPRAGYAMMAGLGYIEKFFWPQRLYILYLRSGSFPVGEAVFSVAILLGVSVLVVSIARRRPYLAVGWLWFLLMLLPVSGLVQVGPQFMADRYTYLPEIGLALMLAWGADEFAERLGGARARQLLSTFIAVALLVGCVVLSRRQLGYWRNTETLMEHAIEFDPNNYVAHNNLGAYYSRLGRVDQAREQYRRVRELDREK